MKSISYTGLALVAFIMLYATVESAFAQSCRSLWIERNSIYKDAGYCFKTSRAIRFFGNAGCSYDSEAALPLSRGERARIQRIRRLERELGCD